MRAQSFPKLVLDWFDQHGRKHLPWQQNKTPYRVWISEIMLQQTQVSTVIPYYERFMRAFPDLAALANAGEDEVLHLWSGLGYYSRARNLRRAAQRVMQEYQGRFPDNLDDLLTLPGIGQSTAGAILAIAFGQRAPILDGNVKRVLARFHAISEPVNQKHVEKQLWELAEKYTPIARAADYTQAIMDLGATLCLRGKPQCEACPLLKHCSGFRQGIAASLPKKTSARALPEKSATFLVLRQQGKILLCKRPPNGIWGGLWSFPEIAGEPALDAIQAYCQRQLKVKASDYTKLDPFRHTFSHYHLDIHPVLVSTGRMPARVMEDGKQIWYNPRKPESLGLPKPVEKILRML